MDIECKIAGQFICIVLEVHHHDRTSNKVTPVQKVKNGLNSCDKSSASTFNQ